MMFHYRKEKEVQFAFDILKKMEAAGLTMKQVEDCTNILSDIVKMNNARIAETEPCTVRLQIDDLIIPPEIHL